ncbi:MAG: ATP-binding protein [Planctomycetota bacterium]
MLDKALEFLFLATTMLALGILLRRLRQVEGELQRRRERDGWRGQAGSRAEAGWRRAAGEREEADERPEDERPEDERPEVEEPVASATLATAELPGMEMAEDLEEADWQTDPGWNEETSWNEEAGTGWDEEAGWSEEGEEDETVGIEVEGEAEHQPLTLEGDTRALFVSALTVILGQCERGRGQRQLDGRVLQVIERQARRISDFLERHPAPEVTASPEEGEIIPEECARAAIEAQAALAQERDVNVHLLADPTPAVRADATLLTQALRLLVRAAILSAPEGEGDVTVAVGLLPAEGDPTHIGFAVADDGPGFEPTRLIEVLEPPEGREPSPGTAEFAYALAYSLARPLGVGFVMESAPGGGTRTTIKLPLQPPAAVPTVEETPVAVEAPREP